MWKNNFQVTAGVEKQHMKVCLACYCKLGMITIPGTNHQGWVLGLPGLKIPNESTNLRWWISWSNIFDIKSDLKNNMLMTWESRSHHVIHQVMSIWPASSCTFHSKPAINWSLVKSAFILDCLIKTRKGGWVFNLNGWFGGCWGSPLWWWVEWADITMVGLP